MGFGAFAQTCPTISFPIDGASDIPVDATITWPAVTGINGYVISLGTTPGGTDIVNSRSLGLNNSYRAPTGLPENTLIYVSLRLIPFDQPPIVCTGITFRTVDVTSPPPCSVLVVPDNNASNVTIVTDIVWSYAPTATGYRLSIGTSPGGIDILNDLNVGNVLLYEPPTDLPNDTRIYIQIVPFNENGIGPTCIDESFLTGPAPYSCDPIVDALTGESTSLKPEIDFPNQVGLCGDELPYSISTADVADGFRWYRTNEGAAETLLSESRSVPITGPGRYRYEAYNTIDLGDRTVECSDFKLFTVVVSGIATIESIEVINGPSDKRITVFANGIGEFEFALDDRDGPYQDSPVFENVPYGNHTAFVRDKNGCGIVERSVDRDLDVTDFPKFFTPNGDGINDYWQFVPPSENFELGLKTIYIYDRYGGFVQQIDPNSHGWDGTYLGQPLPSSDFWFRAIAENRLQFSGHFTLKR